MSDNAVILYPETPDDRTCMVYHDTASDTYILYRSENNERTGVEQTLQRMAERLDEILYGE